MSVPIDKKKKRKKEHKSWMDSVRFVFDIFFADHTARVVFFSKAKLLRKLKKPTCSTTVIKDCRKTTRVETFGALSPSSAKKRYSRGNKNKNREKTIIV